MHRQLLQLMMPQGYRGLGRFDATTKSKPLRLASRVRPGGARAALVAAAEGDAAWAALQRAAAWWLGEHANAATGELAGHDGPPSGAPAGGPGAGSPPGSHAAQAGAAADGADAGLGSEAGLGWSGTEALAAASARRPAVAAVVAALQHAAASLPWPGRVAAAHALAKVLTL